MEIREHNGTTRSVLSTRDILKENAFWDQVDKSDEDGCWPWLGELSPQGYGVFDYRERLSVAHHFSWQLAGNRAPAKGMHMDHKCWNRACVNPDHLRVVTPAQNAQNRKGASRNNKSGIRGVSWSNKDKRWVAQAGPRGTNRYLGSFKTVEEAEAVVTAWRRENMPYSLADQEPLAKVA